MACTSIEAWSIYIMFSFFSIQCFGLWNTTNQFAKYSSKNLYEMKIMYCTFAGNYINVRNHISLIFLWVLWGDNYRFGCGMIKSTILNDHLINDNDFIFLKYRCSNGFCDLCILINFFFRLSSGNILQIFFKKNFTPFGKKRKNFTKFGKRKNLTKQTDDDVFFDTYTQELCSITINIQLINIKMDVECRDFRSVF